ncbi:MAG: LicD family protein [Verrucomicrobia bacterium]|nr:LicD family protein [Verrucomicrobiota bacterium]
MSIASLWESFSSWAVYIGLPTTAAYHLLCSSAFLNVSVEDATFVEKAANVCFVPVQYLLAGKVAKPVFSQEGVKMGYSLEQRFCYEDSAIWWKTASAYCALPSSILLGSLLKGVSYLSSDTRERQAKLSFTIAEGGSCLNLQNDYYNSIGIQVVSIDQAEVIQSEGHIRRPGDDNKLKAEKEALRDIVSLLHEAGLIYWLDCGTCLGAYRYGGNIPWDWDVDIAILQKDSDNVRHVLSKLDPEKYAVQDWSSRDKPKTYLKVYVKETRSLIDIYHFAIDEKTQTIQSILSNGDCIFLPESWKIRERRFVMPTPFSFVFPLKKANFDGIEAFVPSSTKQYLQQRYGENIGPVKVYSPITGEYEKDLTHPYWQLLYTR